MKLSIFVAADRRDKGGDPYYEALECYNDLADEVVVVDDKWPKNFRWQHIGETFQKGYERATGDFVIHADIDHFYHEDDFKNLREVLERYNEQPAISFYKKQFLLVDRYNVKSRMVTAVNKKKFGDRIRFDSGNDLCQPSLDGKEIKHQDTVFSGIPIYNYDFCWKTEEIINKDWPRFDRAWKEYSGQSFGSFKDMMVGRFNARGWEKVKIGYHPKYIREKIKNIKPEQFGHSMFGWVEK